MQELLSNIQQVVYQAIRQAVNELIGMNQKRIYKNWQSLIYAEIDSSRLDQISVVNELKSEINSCYKFEFATDEEYIQMLEYLEYSAKEYRMQVNFNHEMRMQAIHEEQEKLLEEEQRKKVLIEADKNYYRRFGRIPKRK